MVIVLTLMSFRPNPMATPEDMDAAMTQGAA